MMEWYPQKRSQEIHMKSARETEKKELLSHVNLRATFEFFK